MQSDIPARRVTYHIKGLDVAGVSMMSTQFHATVTPFEKEPGGFVLVRP